MFRIGEFSKLTQISIRMLRRYDEADLFKPCQINEWTGYRMYSASQIPTLNKIKYLRDSGFGIAEIKHFLDENDSSSILQQLEQKQCEVQESIQKENEKLQRLQLAKKSLLDSDKTLHYNISIKSIPSYHVLSLRRILPNYYAEAELWSELTAYMQKNHLNLSSDTFTIYHDPEYKEENVDVELCVLVDQLRESEGDYLYQTIPAVPFMASTMVYGPFSNIASSYLAFAHWLQENSQYEMSGQSRQIVHRGPWNEKNPENYLIEIQIVLHKP